MNMDNEYMKIMYLKLWIKESNMNDHCSYEHYLSLKKNQVCMGFKPTTSVIPVQCSTN